MKKELTNTNIIQEINTFVQSVSLNSSLSGMLTKIIKNQPEQKARPKHYYFLTDLCNPAALYWTRKRPELKRLKKTARKLELGNQLHSYAGAWFRALDGFSTEEGVVDGAFVGVLGVRGRIDFLIDESIIEFKTKEIPPHNVNDVISKYPQDLEQLAFYSVLYPEKPKTNYLVFMNDANHELKAFKVIVKDHGILKNLLASRINLLNKAIEDEDDSSLGQCRYYKDGCEFEDSGDCFCKNRSPLPTKTLEKAIEIVFDPIFTKKLEDAKRAYKESFFIFYSPLNIIAPRKKYMETVYKLESSWNEPEAKRRYKACLWSSFKKMPVKLNSEDRKQLNQSDKRLRPAFGWGKFKSSMNPNGEEINPYILKVNMTKNRGGIIKTSNYNKAELGIICASYNVNKGYIFTLYPAFNKLIQVFQITYRDTKGIMKIVKDTIDKVEIAKENKDWSNIPKCPSFLNDNGNCPYISECSDCNS